MPVTKAAGRGLRRLFGTQEFNIGVLDIGIEELITNGRLPAPRWLPKPTYVRYHADPFCIESAGKCYVLFERLVYGSSKGHIAVAEIDSSGQMTGSPSVAISDPVHLSYPFTLVTGAGIYCIPESCRAKEVRVYRMGELPTSWSHYITVLSGIWAGDNTVFEYDDRWWLLSCVGCPSDGVVYKLFAWHAPLPLGPWTPHSRNPVKTDIRSSRPGGTPFWCNGRLYRPSQDCWPSYGARIVINRICDLSPSEFREEPVAFLEPDPQGPYPHGLHTVSRMGNRTVIDGARRWKTAHPVKLIGKYAEKAMGLLAHR